MKSLYFKNISEIGPDAEQDLSSVGFITFDMDWAHDDVIAYTLDMLEEAEVKSTWFVTHATPLLDRMRKSPLFELAIHPNFNDLLIGGGLAASNDGAEAVVDHLMDLVPHAKAVRSHSLTQSSRLLSMFYEKGLIYDCNDFIPYEANMNIRPWKHWSGLTKVPHCWEDDIEAEKENPMYHDLCALKLPLRVFDFHPIHIFLNTDTPARYSAARQWFQDVPKLMECINNDGAGSRTALHSLLKCKD